MVKRDNEDYPPLDSAAYAVDSYRKKGDLKIFAGFMQMCMKVHGTSQVPDKLLLTMKMSHLITPESEALTLWIIEDKLEVWRAREEARNGTTNAVELPQAKYTLKANMSDKNGGVKMEGIMRFMTLLQEVKKQRAVKSSGEDIEEDYRRFYTDRKGPKKRKQRQDAEEEQRNLQLMLQMQERAYSDILPHAIEESDNVESTPV